MVSFSLGWFNEAQKLKLGNSLNKSGPDFEVKVKIPSEYSERTWQLCVIIKHGVHVIRCTNFAIVMGKNTSSTEYRTIEAVTLKVQSIYFITIRTCFYLILTSLR